MKKLTGNRSFRVSVAFVQSIDKYIKRDSESTSYVEVNQKGFPVLSGGVSKVNFVTASLDDVVAKIKADLPELGATNVACKYVRELYAIAE